VTRLEAPAVSDGRIDAVVAATFPDLSRSRARVLIEEGRVTVAGVVVVRPATQIEADDVLAVEVPAPTAAEALPQDLPLVIVYEDADVVVVDKHAGMVVHPAPGHADGTLVNALLHHVDDLSGIGGVQRPGIVHRLDRGTSGLIVVAKNDAAHASLSAQFAEHTAGRVYVALCVGTAARQQGTIRSLIGRDPKDRQRFASVTDPEHGREAVTHWRVRGRAPGLTLMECRLETGRTHQIRVHLCEAGLPLVGDPLYRRRNRQAPGALKAWVDAHPDRPLLHAWQLAFEHPTTGEDLTFTAEPPEDFLEALASIPIPWR